MAFWLLKTEPSTYSFDDLLRDKSTTWDGVANAAAMKNIRAMKKSDLALIYHTGDERAAVGTAKITGDSYPDPKLNDSKMVVIDLKVGEKLKSPVTLNQMKTDDAFAGFDLIRIGRLSVVSVPEKMWERILVLSKAGVESK